MSRKMKSLFNYFLISQVNQRKGLTAHKLKTAGM